MNCEKTNFIIHNHLQLINTKVDVTQCEVKLHYRNYL